MTKIKNIIYYGVLSTSIAFLSGCGGGKNKNKPSEYNLTTNIENTKTALDSVRNLFMKSNKKLGKKYKSLRRVERDKFNCDIAGSIEFIYSENISKVIYDNCKFNPINGEIFNNGDISYFFNTTNDESLILSYAIDMTRSYDHKFDNASFFLFEFLGGLSEIEENLSFFNISTKFNKPTNTFHLYGAYDIKLDWTDSSVFLGVSLADINNFEKVIRITEDTNSGTEWSKMDVNLKEYYRPSENDTLYKEEDFLYKEVTINTNKVVFNKDISTQYKLKTIKPFKSYLFSKHPATGEMTIYNSTDNSSTKLTVIDETNVELSIDFNNDGIPDYNQVITWNSLLNI